MGLVGLTGPLMKREPWFGPLAQEVELKTDNGRVNGKQAKCERKPSQKYCMAARSGCVSDCRTGFFLKKTRGVSKGFSSSLPPQTKGAKTQFSSKP
jgi:hypothetical protein